MTQSTLKALLDKVRDAEKLKNTEVTNWDPSTRAGMEMARNRAIAEYDDLVTSYMAAVRPNSVAVFLTGPQEAQDQFTALAQDLGVPVVDAKAFYLAVTRDAAASLTQGRFTPSEYAHVMHGIRTVLYEDLKVAEFQRPDLLPLFIRSVAQKDLVNEVATAFVAKNGHDIAAQYLARLAAKEALASGYMQSVVPVIVYGATTQEIEALPKSGRFTGRTSIIVPLEDVKVNEEVVRDVLTQTGADFAVKAEPEPVVEQEQVEQVEEPEAVVSQEAVDELLDEVLEEKPKKKSKKSSK